MSVVSIVASAVMSEKTTVCAKYSFFNILVERSEDIKVEENYDELVSVKVDEEATIQDGANSLVIEGLIRRKRVFLRGR